MTHTLTGACHCGALHLTFETPTPLATLPLRACACSFCRKHGVRTTSDPAGAVTFKIDDPGLLRRYRFGTRTTDTLICRNCGIYLAAVTAIEDALYAVINVNALDDQSAFERPAEIMNYDGESAGQRQARRQAKWTPATLDVGHAAR
jgi:hypothetical protein